MRVSVIVPLYNKAPYVSRALSSISAQTFRDFEVIVVNDGSTDNGAEIASRHGDDRVRVVPQSNAGPGAARNRGIAYATGDFLAFLDADDEWMPDYLAANLALLDDSPPDTAAVTCGFVEYPGRVSRESMWRRRGLADGHQRITSSTPGMQLVHALAFMSPCSTVIRANVVRKFGGFYERRRCTYAEDATLFLKVLLNHSVRFQMAPFVIFHREASGLSSNYKKARPVEPFLSDPDDVISACPSELLPLLQEFLCIRACKTAAVLGYWGEWRAAREIVGRFVSLKNWKSPFFAPALIGCTPIAGLVGRVLMLMQLERAK